MLWLGSNPNVPHSLELIKKQGSESDYKNFVTQKESGHFSEVDFDKTTSSYKTGWDPVNNPNHKWSFYTEIFNEIYGKGNILMANFLPWGSKDFKTFLKEVKKIDSDLLERTLDFSRKLNLLLVNELKPELIVIPKSIERVFFKKNHLHTLKGSTEISSRTDAKVTFNFKVRKADIASYEPKIIVCPHPSYTPRVGVEFRGKIQNKIKDALHDI